MQYKRKILVVGNIGTNKVDKSTYVGTLLIDSVTLLTKMGTKYLTRKSLTQMVSSQSCSNLQDLTKMKYLAIVNSMRKEM